MKTRSEFGDEPKRNFAMEGGHKDNGENRRKLVCKNCEKDAPKRKLFFSKKVVEKPREIKGRICENCGEEFFKKCFAKYCCFCRTESARKRRAKK